VSYSAQFSIHRPPPCPTSVCKMAESRPRSVPRISCRVYTTGGSEIVTRYYSRLGRWSLTPLAGSVCRINSCQLAGASIFRASMIIWPVPAAATASKPSRISSLHKGHYCITVVSIIITVIIIVIIYYLLKSNNTNYRN